MVVANVIVGIGPAGKLLELMDRHPFRPAHIHIIVRLSPSPFHILIDWLVGMVLMVMVMDGRLHTTATSPSRRKSSIPRINTLLMTRCLLLRIR